MLATGPLLSPWIVFPIAAIVMFAIALHVEALRRAAMPPSRKRLRLANAWIMLAAAPLIAFGFGAAGASGIGGAWGFVLAWTAVFILMGAVLALAVLDMLNTLRLARRQRRDLAEHMRRVRGSLSDPGPAPPSNDEPNAPHP